jgi:hypothetical protein
MFKTARFPAGRRSRGHSVPITVRPTETDVAIARAIALNTASAPEEVARALTWGADEKLLMVLASAGWLASRGRSESLRRAGNHALLVTVAASLLPHAMKKLFDQTRPDRRTVIGHVHGIPFSGKREDSFPPVTRCTWARWPPLPVHCQPAPAGRSERSLSGSR